MRFWRDGLGFTELFDHTFSGNWPELFGAHSDQLRSIFLGDPQAPETGIVELVVFEGAGDAPTPAPAPRQGFFLLSLQRHADAATSGIAAPDGVLAEAIGPPRCALRGPGVHRVSGGKSPAGCATPATTSWCGTGL